MDLTQIQYIPAYFAFNFNRNCQRTEDAHIASDMCFTFSAEKVCFDLKYSSSMPVHRQVDGAVAPGLKVLHSVYIRNEEH